MDDPMAKAIHGLLDHAVETDRRLALMIQRLEAAGVPVNGDGESVDDFDAERLGKMVD